MSAHVLLNLLNELGKKRYNARLAKHFIFFFRNEFNKFSSTRARLFISYRPLSDRRCYVNFAYF